MAHDIAWLFPGQGSQKVGMGRDLWEAHPVAKRTFAEADESLGFSLSRIMFEGPKSALDDTANTQPALYVHSLALVRVAEAEGLLPSPAWVAGHSLGEYSALTAAGALPFDAGLRLVRLRGELMKAAGEQFPGSMAAVLGLDSQAVAELCAEASRDGEPVQVANFNSPGQVVISGAGAAVDRVAAAAKDAGAKRVISLDVSIAAHSQLMAQAQETFAPIIKDATIKEASVPVIANVTAEPISMPDGIREELVAQLTGVVRWSESMHFLLEQGVTTFIEIGSGEVLSNLMKRIDRTVTRQPIATLEALQAYQQS